MMNLGQFDWNNQKVLERGRLAPRVHFYPYEDAELAAQGGETSRAQSLNGEWNFSWFSSPLKVPEQLLSKPYDPKAPSIAVPLNWQFAGYGKNHYTDLLYPFPTMPPHVPAHNETGVYRRAFQIKDPDDGRVMLRFEGVESAFHVFVNGKAAGYSQGSRMPSEFDITELCRKGENLLTVEVYQYSDGSYLEDQDMWWLGGITRDVLLLHRPACRLVNCVLDPDYDTETGEGILRPVLPVSEEGGHTVLEVRGETGKILARAENGESEVRVKGVSAWTAETPHLYTVIVSVYDAAGQLTEAVPQKVGFRHIEIRDGVLLVNESPIFMRGVNRHEFNAKTGRAITKEQTEQELRLIKDAGLNAIRCSHYPNNPFFYDICDELGLYVIDECDLESHGLEPLGRDKELNSDAEWKEVYLDRVIRMVGRDRNRACVVIWSLGNESAYGPNFKAMYDWCKRNEPSRPVHYEGDFKNEAVDVSSTMYSTIGELAELDLQLEPKRPHIHCEFAHAMGNGPGSLKEYFDICEHSNRIQGIFVWEFKDHGIYEKRADGTELYRFGGEYGEAFHNGNFCMDGLVRSDGVPTPGFWEYSRVAQPIHVERFDLKKNTFTLKNRFDFLDLSGFACTAAVTCDGKTVRECPVALPAVAPHATAEVQLPQGLAQGCQDGALVVLNLRFEDTQCVPPRMGGSASCVLREEKAAEKQPAGPAQCEQTDYTLKVSGRDFSFVLDPVYGRVRDYRANGVQIIEDGPILNYNRAYTDNDMRNKAMWDEKHLHSMQMCVESIDWQTQKDALVITVKGKFSPAALDWGTDVSIEYRVQEDGALTAAFTGDFYTTMAPRETPKIPRELPKIGTESHIPASLHRVVWRGFGPGECYCDSRQAQSDNIWQQDAAEMGFAYSCPQENANRTGVRWAVLSDENGAGFAVAADRPIDFAVRAYSDDQLRKTQHSCDLVPEDRLYLQLDYRNSGLGSGSCGPAALAQYKAFPVHYAWKMAFVPLRSEETAAEAGRRAMSCL